MTGRTALLLCTSLLLSGALAGCTGSLTEPDPPAVVSFLSDHAGCPWTYPDRSSVDCESRPSRIELDPAPPVHSVCIGQDPQQGWKAYWTPQSEHRGVFIDLGMNGTFDGVLALETGGKTYLYEWRGEPTRGFLQLDAEYAENFTFRLMLYNTTYLLRSEHGDSTDGDEIWSQYDGRYWLVHELRTPSGTYTFQDMERLDVERRTEKTIENVTFWDPHSFIVDGADFSLTVLWSFEHAVRSLNRIPSTGIDRGCAI